MNVFEAVEISTLSKKKEGRIVATKAKKLVRVRKTTIGRGVFAQKEIQERKIIGEIAGDVMGLDFESDYCMDLDGKGVLEPDRPFRFLNHSCTPNCELLLWKDRKIGDQVFPRLWLRAVRTIRPGEELTIDYAWPAEAAVPCRCRTANCREWIVDEADLPKLKNGKLRKKLAKMVAL